MIPIHKRGSNTKPKIRALRKMPKRCLTLELPEFDFAFMELSDNCRQYVCSFENVVVKNFDEFIPRLIEVFGYYADGFIITPLSKDECDVHIYLSEKWRLDAKKRPIPS